MILAATGTGAVWERVRGSVVWDVLDATDTPAVLVERAHGGSWLNRLVDWIDDAGRQGATKRADYG